MRQCNYNDIIRYADWSLEQKKNIDHQKKAVNRFLTSITYYYEFVTQKTPSIHNYARNFRIKCNEEREPHDFPDHSDLMDLYYFYDLKTPRHVRNRVILGFIIFQGLTISELKSLKLEDLDSRKGHLNIRESNSTSFKKSNGSRIIKLDAIQMVDLVNYLSVIRPAILSGRYLNLPGRRTGRKRRVKTSDQLILSLKGSSELKNTLHHLILDLKTRYPTIRSASQLRQSRIKYWVSEYNLRHAQYLAGHRYVSSTEWYKGTNFEVLKKEINLYHPLKLNYS